MRPVPQPHEIEREFSNALAAAGFQPGHIELDTDGFVRFDAPGDKAGKKNGFYKVKSGKFPVGWYGDWKQGDQQTQWNYFGDDRTLTDAEKKEIAKESRRLKMEAQVERETKQAEVAADASAMWIKAAREVEGHPYLDKKGIDMPRSLRVHLAKDGSKLIAVPMYAFDMNGQPQLTNLQMIDPTGQKRFLKGGRVDGCFFSLKGDGPIIVICEGVATAFSIWQATGLSTVAAFNSGNLASVAQDFRRWRPDAALLIAGDNDEIAPDDWAERGQGRPWKNAGALAAKKSAEMVECRWILPVFDRGSSRDRTDFNDLLLLEGQEAVTRQVGGAFKRIEDEGSADQPQPALIVEFDRVQDETWRSEVPRTSQGSLDGGNVQAIRIFIENHRLLKGRLRFNQLTKEVELDGNELEDFHVAEYRRILHFERLKSRKADTQDEMVADARRNTFDPLADYLAGVKWDGKPRVDGWLSAYIGVPDSAIVRKFARKFLIGAVARALSPGCKFDTMLVIEGPQDAGKSTALRYLFGDAFFTDHLPDFHSKDSFQQLQGAWCIEVAELSALGKADIKDVKQFLSRLVDKYRPPYGKAPITVPRRTVFAGTVNPEDNGYLRDPTGARRFWPVKCGTIDLPGILRDRDQLWSEAVRAFADGEKYYLDDAASRAAAALEQRARREIHPWEAAIEMWVRGDRGIPVTETTIARVLSEAVKMPPEKQAPVHSRAAGAALRALGWRDHTARLGPDKKPTLLFYAPGHHPDDLPMDQQAEIWERDR